MINIKFSIEFEQNNVNINLLDHLVRENIISIIVEASSHFQMKAFFPIFQLLKWSIVKFAHLKSLEYLNTLFTYLRKFQ
jgi:hypothetical protein